MLWLSEIYGHYVPFTETNIPRRASIDLRLLTSSSERDTGILGLCVYFHPIRIFLELPAFGTSLVEQSP
jgi:hypothetical protein